MARYDAMVGRPTFRWPSGARKAQRAMAKLRKKGQAVSPVVDRGAHDRRDLLGQGLVRQPRALQRLREPPAARPHLCAQRLGGRSADRAGEVEAMVSGSALYKVAVSIAAVAKAHWQSICKDCAGGIDSLVELLQGSLSQGCDGAHLPAGRRAVSAAGRDPLLVQLPGLGRDVQACRGGALRRRRPPRQQPELLFRCALSTRTSWWLRTDQVLPMSKRGACCRKSARGRRRPVIDVRSGHGGGRGPARCCRQYQTAACQPQGRNGPGRPPANEAGCRQEGRIGAGGCSRGR